MKKAVLMTIAVLILLGTFYIVLSNIFPEENQPEYLPADDEIVLHIQLKTNQDVGLIVYDYQADEREYSGGLSNADKSLIKSDSDNIQVWSREELDSHADSVEMSIRFRIITDYVEPNYENIYPEKLTEHIDPISWRASFGESYSITITGDKNTGYKAVLNK